MYTLLFKSPCRIPTHQGSTFYYVGDVLEVEDSDYDFIEQNFQKYFTVMGYTEPQKIVQKTIKKTKTEVEDKTSLLTEQKEIKVIHTAGVPLAEDAPWQEVKSYILKLEEEIPVDLQAIAEVKVKFGNYPSVVKECERILTTNNATVK